MITECRNNAIQSAQSLQLFAPLLWAEQVTLTSSWWLFYAPGYWCADMEGDNMAISAFGAGTPWVPSCSVYSVPHVHLQVSTTAAFGQRADVLSSFRVFRLIFGSVGIDSRPIPDVIARCGAPGCAETLGPWPYSGLRPRNR